MDDLAPGPGRLRAGDPYCTASGANGVAPLAWAEHILNSSEPDFYTQLHAISSQLEATLILDPVGGEQTLNEFKRVQKAGGRLILLNMSKEWEKISFREKLYAVLPAAFVLYILGACRPVLMEEQLQASGFERVSRTL